MICRLVRDLGEIYAPHSQHAICMEALTDLSYFMKSHNLEYLKFNLLTENQCLHMPRYNTIHSPIQAKQQIMG